MNSLSRDHIFRRIREGLQRRPAQEESGIRTGRKNLSEPLSAPRPPEIPEALVRQVERVSATRLWELFASRLALLGDVALRADTIPEAIDTLGKQVDALRLKHGIADEEVFHWLGKKELKSLPLSKASVEPAGRREQAFTADFGITLCDAAVAESGTLVLASQSGRSRLTSLAPPVHFCLLPFSRLVPDLDDVTRGFHKLKNDNEVWITGSSRTADIEGILIRGVHGPGSLIAIGVASE